MNQQYPPTVPFPQSRPSPVVSPQTNFQTVPLGPAKSPPQTTHLTNSHPTSVGYQQNHTYNSTPPMQNPNFSRAQLSSGTVFPQNQFSQPPAPPAHQLPPQRPPSNAMQTPSMNQTFSHGMDSSVQSIPSQMQSEPGSQLILQDATVMQANIPSQLPFIGKGSTDGVRNGPGMDKTTSVGQINLQKSSTGPPSSAFNGSSQSFAHFPPSMSNQMKQPVGPPQNHSAQHLPTMPLQSHMPPRSSPHSAPNLTTPTTSAIPSLSSEMSASLPSKTNSLEGSNSSMSGNMQLPSSNTTQFGGNMPSSNVPPPSSANLLTTLQPPSGNTQQFGENMPPANAANLATGGTAPPSASRNFMPPMPPQSFAPTNKPPSNMPPMPNMPPSQNMPPVQNKPLPPNMFPPQNMPPMPGKPGGNVPPFQGMPPGSNMPPMQNKPPGPNLPPMQSLPPMQNLSLGPNLPPGSQSNFPPGLPQHSFGQPLAPGQLPPSQFGPPPLPVSDNRQYNLPSQTGKPLPYTPEQVAKQMQQMKMYPPGQMTSPTGLPADGLHMPPPLSQQQQQQQQQLPQGYVNGQQMRSPQAPPGYPPMPGGPGGYPQTYQQQQQMQQEQRRLDPDQMPSPIQVMMDDQQSRSGVFVTNQKGLVPPLVTTKFVVEDQGNCSPRYVRSTMYNVPITQDLMKQTMVPFGLVISPMARIVDGEYPPPIVNFGDLGPVRCVRCKAYICPYMQFIDAGRRFQCLFCKAATDVPTEYFQHLDHTGQRMDRFERPELILGTYEFTATTDYCRNSTFPKEPAFIFIIDVSYNNIKSGLVNLLCSQMREILNNLPIDQDRDKSNMKVGFITYNSSVHFYNIKGSLAAPQMMIVGDTHEMFMPLLDGFLCTPEEAGTVLDSLMQQIPLMFKDTRETETVLLPAILAGLEALKASERVGKLLVFHSSLPSADAPGRLKSRDDRKLLGTDKEKTVLTPQTQAYNQLGQDCVQSGCSVDLFLFNNTYIDVATIGQVSRLTGGEVFKYTYFQAETDGDRLINDITNDINRPVAFDGVMRVRTSTGVRPTDFYGHCFMSNTTDVELASIDCDKAIAVEIKHDDKLSEEEGIYIQVALLYTSCSGQRRLRILNLSLKTCSQMSDLYRSCELDTIINFFSKQAVYKLLEANPKAIKDGIVNRAAQILASYRKNCASPSSAGQLILPECMKVLPLYVNCLLKNDALSGGSDMTIDDRSFVMQAVMTMNVQTSVGYFYPRLIPLHLVKDDQDPVQIPPPIRCTQEKMNEQGVYLLENGIHMFLWIGLAASPEFLERVFGVSSAVQVNIESQSLPILDNPLSEAVRFVIDQIRTERHRCMRLTMVRQREKMEPVFKHFLVEDRGVDGSQSYVDFLCHMHKEIRNILS